MATKARPDAYADYDYEYAYASPPSPQTQAYDNSFERREAESRPFYARGEYRTFEEQERWEERQRYENALLRPEPIFEHRRSRSDDYDRRRTSEYSPRLDPRTARHHSDQANDKNRERTTSPTVGDRFERLHVEEDAVKSSDSSSEEGERDLSGKCSKCIELLRSASRQFTQSSKQQYDPAANDIAVFARRLEDQAFHLDIWVNETKIEDHPDEAEDQECIRLAHTVLTRLLERTKKLVNSGKSCEQANKWRFDVPSHEAIDNDLSDGETSSLPSTTLSLPASIDQDIKAIELQIRTLRRLTRSVRQTHVNENETALKDHVAEIKKYFGTEKACKIYSTGDVVPPYVALERAREIASGVAVK